MRKVSKQDKVYNKKLRDIKTLSNKALKKSVKLKCSPGLKFLKDVSAGRLIKCGDSQAVVLESTDTSCTVIVTSHEPTNNNDSFYLGNKRWGPKSEVEVLD
tara:strand:- start:2188 stop:2490 length:303 start_codon:yes stop_codon:yes gene_type:complete